MEALPSFTAARIAAVLGRDKRGLLRVLKSVPATGQLFIQGRQFANAWSVESLPENYRADLDRLAKIKGCRNPVHLLSEGIERWKPPIPLPELAEHHVTKAIRTKNALSRAIALYVNPRDGIERIYRMALQDYQKEFGVVSDRTVRRIFDRVIGRDAGEENFDDVALYLDDRLSRAKGREAILPGLLSPHEQAVFRYLNEVKRPGEPTVQEMDLIWFSVCESLHAQEEEGFPSKGSRRAMVAFLDKSAVTLAKNSDALKVTLKRKYARYVECGGDFNLMCDKRHEKSGWKRALVLPDEDRKLIVAHAALNRDGRLAQALRELRRDGKLGHEIETRHVSNPASKSYVPKSIRDQVRTDIRMQKNMVHGPRTHQLRGAYLTRDYSMMAAGDWAQADDVTAPVYYWDETEKGIERMRGQWLVMIDVRTDFILGFVLISQRNYNSLAIRSLITVCASKHGLPRRGFYLENGIWRTSKIIAGDRNAVPFEHADRGLRSLGMELRHARLPRAKVVERTIGRLQDRMEGLPGYVGRDERHDVRERLQRQFLDIDAGRRPINEVLLSKAQYSEKLAAIVEAHNEEPQEGRLNGMSPREAWESLQGNEPRQGFSAAWRYVLARDVRKLKIGRNGITLRYGKNPFVYRNEETGKRVGEEVLCWFDPMLPDVLACTDLDHKNVFSVPLSNAIPAMDAPEDLLRDEMEKIEGHQVYAKNLFYTSQNTLKTHHYITTIPDAATLEIGETIATQRTQITARQDETRRRVRTNRDLIEKAGLRRELMQSAETTPTEVLQSLNRLKNEAKAEETP